MSTNNPKIERNYIHLNGIEAINQELIAQTNIDDKFLIGHYNNQSRFILNDGTLLVVSNATPQELFSYLTTNLPKNYGQNKVRFNLANYHASINIKCAACYNGKPTNKTYDFSSSIRKEDNYLQDPPINLHPILDIYLTEDQSLKVWNTLEKLYNESNVDETYKYVNLIHNCVAFLTDTYKQSGFNGHFSQFFIDKELLETKHPDTSIPSIVQRYYYPAQYLEDDRPKISKFVRSILQEKYHDKWQEHLNEKLDLEKALAENFIAEKLNEINETRKEYLPGIIRESLNYSEIKSELNENDYELITEYMMTRPLDYNDLYYTYILKHQVKIMEIFKDTIYYEKIIKWFEDDSGFICNDDNNPAPSSFDRICTMWCQTQEENLSSCDKYLSPNNSHQLCGLTIDSLYIV